MGALVTRRLRTRQPQQFALADPRWLARGLKFAILPSVGFVNLADGSAPLQVSGPIAVSATDNGVAFTGTTDTGTATNSRAEFKPVTISGGLTVVSIWRARVNNDYLGADSSRTLVSTRNSSNVGWSYGRLGAIAGGATGNLTQQSFTVQGVAQYSENAYTIESKVDTPVACRYDPNGNKLSFFRFGVRSSNDQTISAPAAGGNLVFGAQGAFADNGQPWWDRNTITLVFDQALSDGEVAELHANMWQAIKPAQRRLWAAVAGSVGGSRIVTAAGGIVFGGASPHARISTRQPGGGVQFAGGAQQSRIAARSSTGGVQLAGTAAQVRARAAASAGGLQLSGAASIATTAVKQLLTVVAAGGIAFAGAAARAALAIRAAIGGLTVGGSADYTNSGIVPRLSAIMRRRARPRNFPTSR